MFTSLTVCVCVSSFGQPARSVYLISILVRVNGYVKICIEWRWRHTWALERSVCDCGRRLDSRLHTYRLLSTPSRQNGREDIVQCPACCFTAVIHSFQIACKMCPSICALRVLCERIVRLRCEHSADIVPLPIEAQTWFNSAIIQGRGTGTRTHSQRFIENRVIPLRLSFIL